MSTVTRDAIAEACAELNNVALPNVLDILRALEALTAYAKLDPCMEQDPRVRKALQIQRDYAPHI